MVLATMVRSRKKIQFHEREQAYIPISDCQANVPFVQDAVREKWGHNIGIVTSNGLPIVDEPGTRGLQWWRCPSRRLYAIEMQQQQRLSEEQNQLSGRGKRPRLSSSARLEGSEVDSEDDFISPSLDEITGRSYDPTEQQREESVVITSEGDDDGVQAPPTETTKTILEAIQEVSARVEAMKETMDSSSSYATLRGASKTAFRCVFCLDVAKPPIVVHPGCGRVVGCETCSEQHLIHGSSVCPLCRGEVVAGDSFVRLNGFDQVLDLLQ